MLLVFTVLTAVMTYPQVSHLHDRVHDDGDPLLETWILAWVAHQLPRAPARIFDANIFYPERETLAVLGDAAAAGCPRRAAALGRRRAGDRLQPRIPVGVRRVGCRHGAAGAHAHEQHRSRRARRHHLRVPPVPHRSLPAPAAAADAVPAVRVLGVPPAAAHRPGSRWRALRSLHGRPGAVVHVLRPLPGAVHGRGLRRDAAG